MKRFLYKSGIFFLIFSIFFVYLNKVFKTENYYTNTIEDFKELSKRENIDVLFLGSSHSYTAFNPLLVDSITNTVSYNLGSDGLRLAFTDVLFEEVLKYTKPKLVILELYRGSIVPLSTPQSKGYQLRALDIVPNYNINKQKKIWKYYNSSEYFSALFPLIRNHKKWVETDFFDISNRKDYKNLIQASGFINKISKVTKEDSIKFKDFKIKKLKPKKSNFITKTVKEDINKIKELTKKAGAKLLIVTAPDLRVPFSNSGFLEELDSFCKKRKIDYLNLNQFYNSIDLKVTDFRDPSHLNIFGANKTSKFLGNFLKKNYQLPNKKAFNKSRSINNTLTNMWVKLNHSGTFKKEIDKDLLPGIKLSRVTLIEKNDSFLIEIAIKNHLKDSVLKYKLVVHLFESLEEKKLMVSNFVLKKDTSMIYKKIIGKEKIVTCKKIKFFLYDKAGYRKTIGKTIWLDIKD